MNEKCAKKSVNRSIIDDFGLKIKPEDIYPYTSEYSQKHRKSIYHNQLNKNRKVCDFFRRPFSSSPFSLVFQVQDDDCAMLYVTIKIIFPHNKFFFGDYA